MTFDVDPLEDHDRHHRSAAEAHERPARRLRRPGDGPEPSRDGRPRHAELIRKRPGDRGLEREHECQAHGVDGEAQRADWRGAEQHGRRERKTRTRADQRQRAPGEEGFGLERALDESGQEEERGERREVNDTPSRERDVQDPEAVIGQRAVAAREEERRADVRERWPRWRKEREDAAEQVNGSGETRPHEQNAREPPAMRGPSSGMHV